MNPTQAILPIQDLSALQRPRDFRIGLLKKLLLAVGVIATSGWMYLLSKAAWFMGRAMFS
jgi:hypothetical protein